MAEFALDYEHLSDVELARLVAQRDSSAARVITRRNNQRFICGIAPYGTFRNTDECPLLGITRT